MKYSTVKDALRALIIVNESTREELVVDGYIPKFEDLQDFNAEVLTDIVKILGIKDVIDLEIDDRDDIP